MSSSNNLENKNQSFLNKSNSGFIEEMYIKFIEGDPNLPESWRNYFEDLNEDLEIISKESHPHRSKNHPGQLQCKSVCQLPQHPPQTSSFLHNVLI